MAATRKKPDPQKQAQLRADLRREQAQREKSYRGRALAMFPHVCASCSREFEGKRLRELTVHHKNHDHDFNPPDGSNWELLCLYCHDHEHEKFRMKGYGGGPAAAEPQGPGLANPFEGLDALLAPAPAELRFRPIVEADVPALFSVRAATRENRLSLDDLRVLGITEDSVRSMLSDTHRGWLCEEADRVAGFAMGNSKTGEMWVIAVLPEYEARGIGAELLSRVEDWLWSLGWEEAWLTTDMDTRLRAYGFYLKQGWSDAGMKDGCRLMKKKRPALT